MAEWCAMTQEARSRRGGSFNLVSWAPTEADSADLHRSKRRPADVPGTALRGSPRRPHRTSWRSSTLSCAAPPPARTCWRCRPWPAPSAAPIRPDAAGSRWRPPALDAPRQRTDSRRRGSNRRGRGAHARPRASAERCRWRRCAARSAPRCASRWPWRRRCRRWGGRAQARPPWPPSAPPGTSCRRQAPTRVARRTTRDPDAGSSASALLLTTTPARCPCCWSPPMPVGGRADRHSLLRSINGSHALGDSTTKFTPNEILNWS